MRRTFTLLSVAFVLTTCLVCPVLEMFDHWDHTLKTGNDTESSLVILALCIGVVYASAKLVVALCPRSAASLVSGFCSVKAALFPLIHPTTSALSESPPLNLRI
jgi:hypothetical protein